MVTGASDTMRRCSRHGSEYKVANESSGLIVVMGITGC